jgi:hypothetical protein
MPRKKTQKGQPRRGEQQQETRRGKQKWIPMEKVDMPPSWSKPGKQIETGSLNERNQAKAQMLSDHLFLRRKSLHKTMGESFASTELPPTERLAQYKELIASKELLIKALAGAAIVGRDGRLRISTAMVDAFAELSDARR